MGKINRPGSQRSSKKKGPLKGTGGLGRKALQGRGPTPKAEDRVYHKAHKQKNAQQKRAAHQDRGRARRSQNEYIAGRNSVVEALRAGVPAKALYVAQNLELDDRVREAIQLAMNLNLPLMEGSKFDLDRLTNDAVHQGVALQIPPYEYAHPEDLAQELLERGKSGGDTPLLVALDGITDPRNLGAILRSAGAFGGQGVIIPERRSVGMTASAWKTSAGAGARVPVAQAGNLNNTLKALRSMGYFVVGLDADGGSEVTHMGLAREPLVVVVGAEGEGLSRLSRELCDEVVSIPMHSETESLNAGVAAGIALFSVSVARRADR